MAANATKVQESDPQAQALGDRDDSSKVDAAKYPKHTPSGVRDLPAAPRQNRGHGRPLCLFGAKHVAVKASH